MNLATSFLPSFLYWPRPHVEAADRVRPRTFRGAGVRAGRVQRFHKRSMKVAVGDLMVAEVNTSVDEKDVLRLEGIKQVRGTVNYRARRVYQIGCCCWRRWRKG